jgi:methionyl-tRNA formyltransferase
MNNEFRLIFITQDDPFYVRCFFEEFFKIYPDLSEIQGIVIQRPMGKRSSRALMKQMYAFYGPFDFFRMGCRYLKSKGLTKLADIYPRLPWLGLNQVCLTRDIKVLYQDNINQPDFLDRLRQLNLDLIISVAAPSIFKEQLINLPRLGCINIHHAPLPQYRGMMPNFWQLCNGEKTVGITVHKINHRIDEGEIILQRRVTVKPRESLDALIKRTKRQGAHCMVEAVQMLRNGKVQYLENKPDQGSYFPFPKREDVKRFREMGYRLL